MRSSRRIKTKCEQIAASDLQTPHVQKRETLGRDLEIVQHCREQRRERGKRGMSSGRRAEAL